MTEAKITTPKITELEWERHPEHFGGERSYIKFPNGYAASCLRGSGLGWYTRNGTYEIAVMDDEGLNYKTHITDDVLGYLSEEAANKALCDIANLPESPIKSRG